MWPTSNGYSYTDSNFKCNLPALCDEQGNIADPITNFYQDQTTSCDICSASLTENDPTITTDPNTILPVVIEGPDSRDPSALHAIWPDNHALEGVRRTCQAAAHILVSLCIHCQTRAFTLMETSDHAAIGSKHWPLLVANLRKQLTDPGWDKYAQPKSPRTPTSPYCQETRHPQHPLPRTLSYPTTNLHHRATRRRIRHHWQILSHSRKAPPCYADPNTLPQLARKLKVPITPVVSPKQRQSHSRTSSSQKPLD